MRILHSFWKGRKEYASLQDELADFYRQHERFVYAYFYKVTGSAHDSEELTQETFYQAIKSIHRFKGNASIKTWLMQIAINVYRNKVRTWERDRKVFSSEEVDVFGDHTHDPQRIALINQSRNEILRLFQQLPEDYRDILILKEIEGLSHSEIAQILNKTPQTTKVLLYRAKRKFKQLYEEEVISREEPL